MQDVDVDRIRDLITHGAQLNNPPQGWRELIDSGFGFVHTRRMPESGPGR